MKQSRFKSPVALLSFFFLAIKYFNLQAYIGLDENALGTIFDAIVTILIALGIYNNPTDKSKF